jgi:beta-glucosidase/6-phospho-beta-glucosidase/beta-galactosidase
LAAAEVMHGVTEPRPLEVWGGIECSVVRVGDEWRDQVCETGHHRRATHDIDLMASLGLRTLRYPLLWERNIAGRVGGWRWHDRQLEALRRHGIDVVAGLIHHGSGPPGTSLLDPLFPEKLAAHAGRAASRYPWVTAWTSVNEPLTTARFACLYGHWYPHGRDTGMFLRALVNQCRAALLSMRAIRAHVPAARFVHTEDIGRIFATSPMAAQARYENERRWLSLDLLCGRLDRAHPWYAILVDHGVSPQHLDELATGEAEPDLIGVNHYVTSDRFLDHRLRLYPPHLRGGNGLLAYADTEAVRVDLGADTTGWEPRLREVWQRYQRPMAITEVHLGCEDPHESVRWLMEAWNAAHVLRAEGAQIQAITAWALLGLVDWNSMLRERRGHYESGPLDARSDPPTVTPLAVAIASLAKTGAYAHPSLDEAGWWRREERVHENLRRPRRVATLSYSC